MTPLIVLMEHCLQSGRTPDPDDTQGGFPSNHLPWVSRFVSYGLEGGVVATLLSAPDPTRRSYLPHYTPDTYTEYLLFLFYNNAFAAYLRLTLNSPCSPS